MPQNDADIINHEFWEMIWNICQSKWKLFLLLFGSDWCKFVMCQLILTCATDAIEDTTLRRLEVLRSCGTSGPRTMGVVCHKQWTHHCSHCQHRWYKSNDWNWDHINDHCSDCQCEHTAGESISTGQEQSITAGLWGCYMERGIGEWSWQMILK